MCVCELKTLFTLLSLIHIRGKMFFILSYEARNIFLTHYINNMFSSISETTPLVHLIYKNDVYILHHDNVEIQFLNSY